MGQTRVVYVVQHARELGGGDEDVKLIGVFSTNARAERAVRELAERPGFSDWPEGFSIDEYEVDRVYWREGFVTVSPEDA